MKVVLHLLSQESDVMFRKLYLVAGLGSLTAVLYFVYQGYLETRVNTPLDYPK